MEFTSQKLSSPTRDWIERQFALFGTIIPTSSEDVVHRRTSYFYRKCAIAWAGMSRPAVAEQDLPGALRSIRQDVFGQVSESKTVRWIDLAELTVSFFDLPLCGRVLWN
jgi:hypothetical protein